MFRGLYEHAIDAKGRTSLPLVLRDTLNKFVTDAPRPSLGSEGEDGLAAATDTLIITTGIDRCLVAYPVPEWSALETKLAALSQFDPAVAQLKRIYVAGATECGIDKHGRLLIPPMLREYASLDKVVVWAGMVTTIEIWAKELWVEQVAASRADPKAIARAMTELGL